MELTAEWLPSLHCEDVHIQYTYIHMHIKIQAYTASRDLGLITLHLPVSSKRSE
jgi:hypothetical protein